MTYTRKQVDPLNLRPEDVCIEDIAHALSMKCRYSGHTAEFYSVAQHCVVAADVMCQSIPHLALTMLLHDAAEAYIPDFPRPVKNAFLLRRNNEDSVDVYFLEEEILHTVCLGLGFPSLSFDCPEVHYMDRVMLKTEKRDLWPKLAMDWGEDIESCMPLTSRITPCSAQLAESEFLAMYEYLRHAAFSETPQQ